MMVLIKKILKENGLVVYGKYSLKSLLEAKDPMLNYPLTYSEQNLIPYEINVYTDNAQQNAISLLTEFKKAGYKNLKIEKSLEPICRREQSCLRRL